MKRRKHSKSLTLAHPALAWAGPLSSGALIILAIILVIYSSARPAHIEVVRMGITNFAAPFISTVTKPVQGAAMFVRNVSGLSELQAENAALRDENVRLRDWYQSALLLEAENKSLRDLMNVKLTPEQSFITAPVMADSGNAFAKSLLVEAGRRDRVQKNQAAIAGEGLIGRVIEVGPNVSRILLASDMNSRIPVLVENTSQHAILAGGNESYPTLIHLPAGSSVDVGARIITSGYGGVFPYGIPVGRIVSNAEGAVGVALFADISKTMFVRIVDSQKSTSLQRLNP